VHFEVVLLEAGSEIFCDIFLQAYISNSVALNRHAFEVYFTGGMLLTALNG
jgi:hypothetical protein